MRDRVHNKASMTDRRRKLRRSLTPAETRLWTVLKGSQLAGRKFRRQHGVGYYVLDFYCDSEKLAVELDGEVHKNDNAFDSDAERTAWLRRMGIKVIRIENYLVFRELEYVLHFIQSHFGWHDREAHTTSNSPP